MRERARERAIGKLKRGYATGSLGTQTLEYRLEFALRADSLGVLRRITSDIAPSLFERVRLWFDEPPPERASSGLLQSLAAGSPAVIGRSRSCDVVLRDDSVSRRHVMLRRDGERVTLTDLGSTNGTYVNGRWVTQAEVQPGDRLQLGESTFVL